ncbi:CIA30 family protein [Candidatus Pseudothioglobus singularis]|nr:CIA30 family protein [Candidatus Pseudothioglobus singularis]
MFTINSKAIAVEDLSYPFNSDSGKNWQFISDQVMGGVSVGKVTLEQDGEMFYARLTGNVSTRNYGGVIQLRTGISFANSEKDGKNLQGVRLNVRGNGGIGGTQFTPIINSPEVAILGVSRTQIKPIWNGSTFEPTAMIPLALSYDHRVIDGAEGARFMAELNQVLSNIMEMLL